MNSTDRTARQMFESVSRLFLAVLTAAFILGGTASFAQQVSDIQRAIKERGYRWVAEDTMFSQMSDDEKRLHLGLIKPAATRKNDKVLAVLPAELAALPASYDWRSFVTPIKNQGNCGSCWAFATTAALESYILIKDSRLGQNDDRAEEILLSCSTAGSCKGGGINGAADFIESTGLPPESYFPYTASSSDDTCSNAHPGWQTATYQIASWSWVNTTPADLTAIKNALYIYGPLVTTMDVYNDFYSYSGGVYEYTTGSYLGGHAVLVIGYVDDATVHGGGYFIVKNSWGTGWGQSGYFYISYSQLTSAVQFGEWTIAYHQPDSPSAPAMPDSLKATTVSSSQINLSWVDNSSNEDGFKIARCQGANCTSFAQIANVGSGVTTYSSKGLAPNTTYQYQVLAYNSAGNSMYSNVATAKTLPLPPTAPSGLTAKAVSGTQINLSWTDNSNNESGFKIERCDGAGCTSFVQIISTQSGVNSYWNLSLNQKTTYTYRVRAYNSGGNSSYSNTASATPLSPPAAPSGLTAKAASTSQINLSWTDNSNNESGFKVERCQGVGCTRFVQIVSLASGVKTYSNTGLTPNTSYTYRVRAYNSGGDSAYSNVNGATTLPPPPTAAGGLTATAVSGSQIDLSWTDNSSNEAGFKIESCQGVGCTRFTQIASLGSGVKTYNNTGLTPKTTYTYRVRAYNSGGNSSYSNTASAKTP